MGADGPLRDGLALALVTACALWGAWRGWLASALSIGTLLAAWAIAFVAAVHAGAAVSAALPIPSVLGPPLAGTAAFFAVVAALGLGGRALRRREADRLGESPRPAWDRLGGSLFGALRGGLLALLLAWLALWLDAGHALRQQPRDHSPASLSAVSRLTRTAVEVGVRNALGAGNPGAEVAARTLARPTESLEGLRTVFEHPRVQELADDRLFWTQVEAGSLDAALHRASFLRLANDAALRRELATLGLVDDDAAADVRAFRQDARAILAEVGPRIERVRRDPELQALASDPEVRSLAATGGSLALLRHPRVRGFVVRMLSDENGSEPATARDG